MKGRGWRARNIGVSAMPSAQAMSESRISPSPTLSGWAGPPPVARSHAPTVDNTQATATTDRGSRPVNSHTAIGVSTT